MNTRPLRQFKPLGRNPNKHTPRGMAMLEDSIHRDGYVAPMTAAADGTILDGNARLETVATALPGDPIVIEHDGTRPIIAVRTDIPDGNDPRARRISVAANRIGEVDLAWDADVLKGIAEEVDLSPIFGAEELCALLSEAEAPDLDDPTFQAAGKVRFSVTCPSTQQQVTLDALKRLSSEIDGFTYYADLSADDRA